MVKEIKFNSEATESVLKGINIVADAVKSTFGPNGRNVMIEIEDDVPHITKDGVTVANSIELGDSFESIGAKLIQNVASKTLKDVGDGTTTSTILTQAIVNEGVKELQFGVNVFKLKQGIDLAVQEVTKGLLKEAKVMDKDSEEVIEVAKISANGDLEISKILSDVFKVIGTEGTVTVDNSSTLETTVSISQGIQLNSGYEYTLFAKGEEQIIFENPSVLISKLPIKNMNQLIPTIKKVQDSKVALIIIAPDIDKGVLDVLLANNYTGNLQAVFLKMPGMTEVQREQLDDLGIVIGKPFEMEDTVLGNIELGIISQYKTSFIPSRKELQNIESFKEKLKDKVRPNDTSLTNEKLKERIGKLSGKVATIYISATSEVELKEKKDRLDDAIHAVKAALEEGIVTGAGITLKRVSEEVCEELLTKHTDPGIRTGITLIANVSKLPFNLLNRTVENKDNVLDPVKVVYTTLQNAASVAGLFLTTNCVIVNKN